MKKTTVISLAIVGLIAVALIFVLISKKANAPASDLEMDQKPPQTAIQSGQYVEYDEAKLASSKNNNYLFFHAPWCPQCRAIEASINSGGKSRMT